MDVDALAKTKGGKRGGKGKDKEPETKKFDGNCFWCGAHDHAMKDCRKKTAGKPETAQSPRTPEPEAKGRGKGGQSKKGASSLDGWPDGQEEQPSGEKSGDEVASLFMGANDQREKCNRREGPYRREKYKQRDWQAWERVQKQANRAPHKYIAANAEKIQELGFKTPTLKFQKGDVQNMKFSVMDNLHKPLVAACKVVAAGNRIVMQPESQGGSFIEDVRSKHWKRIFVRNGVYVVPCWLVKQNSQKRLAPLDESYPKQAALRVSTRIWSRRQRS